ncbi:MAG: hypothetical protein QOK88_02110 [Nitrososphaeraceae archaeon]|jgi:hypothetical protein|nr:hypothetical protein [Nitrososphaeraceae archaeon]MDW0134283.1 hypothetical protein [Nitrososphaeraceae archaeon]MDW0139480.1 hypothetical protein [Nitrososphaeraceae archaeon]MDW0155833.1 hypothetical protein [Nitrososphaeraceae archaeon]
MNILVIILVGTIALSLGISYPMMSLAQQEQSEELPDQMDVPMNLTLKLKDGGNEEVNATEAKDVTVNLKVQTGQDGSPTEIPITAKVSNDTTAQDLELCAVVQEGNEMCNSLEDLVKAPEANKSNGTSSDESSDESSSSGNSTENEDEDN